MSQPLTTAAPVQLMKFNESAFDRPKHARRRRAKLISAAGALLVVAIAIVVAL